MAIVNRYEEGVDGATSFQMGEITISTQSDPTNNSTAHQEAIYQDTHREDDREAYRTVDQDATEVANQERTHQVDEMATKADFE
jgi:hypothetical protein